MALGSPGSVLVPPPTLFASQSDYNLSYNGTSLDVLPKHAPAPTFSWSSGNVQIPLYALIFLLSTIGNILVIVTLVQNKRMRTITNVFLLNLAVSDLLLGVFCMPFTLVGTLLREFIFGEIMCKAIPFLQAVSVSVSAWTLVAISVERYFAICQPFRSRRWQTISHAYKTILAVWIGSCSCMIPIASLSTLQPIKVSGKTKCREAWPDETAEKAFNLLLDIVLLIIPIIIMSITYTLISASLWREMRTESSDAANDGGENLVYKPTSDCMDGTATRDESTMTLSIPISKQRDDSSESGMCSSPGLQRTRTFLRRTNQSKNLANKRRIIKMLFVVVFEFFVCWTPLYVINTISLYNPRAVYGGLGTAGISFCQLFAYASSCCNPITYCFMNSRFRHAFISAFSCRMPTPHWESASRASTSYTMKTSSFYVSKWLSCLVPSKCASRQTV